MTAPARIRIVSTVGQNGFGTPTAMLATERYDSATGEYLGCDGPPSADELRAVCRANDPNGDWTDASRDYMVETVARWIGEEPDYWRVRLGGGA